MTQTQLLSVVIPAYNEEKILPSTIKTLTASLEELKESGVIGDYELLLVNDGSTDGTKEILSEAERGEPGRIRALGYDQNRGKGCAVRTGVEASRGDLVLYTDSDLAYGTEFIRDAVKKAEETGADFVIGSRAIHPDGYAGYTGIRKIASKMYLRFLSVAAGFSHSDSQCGFKLLRGETGRPVFACCHTDGFAFDFEVLLRAEKKGLRIEELPVCVINHRESKIHLVRDSVRMLKDIYRIKKTINKETAKEKE